MRSNRKTTASGWRASAPGGRPANQDGTEDRFAGLSLDDPAPLSPDPAAPITSAFIKSPTSHPLLYRRRIDRLEGKPRPGDWVAVYHSEDQLLGYGLYNPRSEIAVRMVRYGPHLPDDRFWNQLIDRAVNYRQEFLGLDSVTSAYRVVHAESDGLPGLVIDRYGDVLSGEAFSLGLWQRGPALLQRFAARLGCPHTLLRAGPRMLSQEGIEPSPLASPELPNSVVISEFGTRFRVRFDEGHKTGFFCDQRDNRRQLAELCREREVLDLCCYTGGFAIQAKKLGQAAEVTGVELDEAPLRLAKENANLNQVRVNFVQADAFAYMRDMLRNARQFDVVVLDPPKLITSRADYDEGARKHFDLNRLAIQLVRPGGVLLTCTCAGLMSETEFSRLLASAARQAIPDEAGRLEHPNGRILQIFRKTGAAADHPVVAHCPETEYLRAVWARVL